MKEGMNEQESRLGRPLPIPLSDNKCMTDCRTDKLTDGKTRQLLGASLHVKIMVCILNFSNLIPSQAEEHFKI